MDPQRHDFYLMLHLPPAVAQVVGRLQRQLNTSYHGPSKPMALDRLHATLVPLGSYQHRIPPEVLRLARSAGALLEEAPFPVCFDTLQSRGPQREVGTVELAGHGAGVRPLVLLRRQLVAALLKVGWPAEWIRPGFTPHITVDYQHKPVSARRIEPLVWEVVEFLLVDSHYGKGYHEVLGRWPLRNRQPSLFD
ncbi:2'-5' RNA ligase family protein [Hydrogenophaga sp. MI9]|uniref:2'-5' RNA ligase family protein n=1 Tax=Hydrogenophaga sp. MI9 TaxID=3453719 RepID=UPI003EEC989D